MKRIYRSLGCGATLNVLLLLSFTVPAWSDAPVPVLWAQPHHMAAGDGFLVLGYRTGLEIWDWSLSGPLTRSLWRPGQDVGGLVVDGQEVIWAADSAIFAANYTGSSLTPIWAIPSAGSPDQLVGSSEYVAMLVNSLSKPEVRYWNRSAPGAVRTWTPPTGAKVATIALRDSTLAAAGAGTVRIVRLGADTTALLDSTTFSVYASEILWAGDTLLLAYGFSGVKLAPTSGDHFADTAQTLSDGGFYEFLTAWDDGWATLGLFGQMLIFERGTGLAPVASLQSEGTSWGLAAQTGLLMILTGEYGLSTLNVFTPQTPFWTKRERLPGLVRAMDYSSLGMLAHADFEGVMRLTANDNEWLMSNPYNSMDLDVDGNLVAATALLTGTALFHLDAPPLQEPLALVHKSVFTRQAELSGDQMFVYTTGACDSGFTICDVSDPANVKIKSRWSVCVPIHDLERVPGALAVAMGDSGIWMYQTPIIDTVPPVERTDEDHRWMQLAWRTGELWSRDDSGLVVRWRWEGDSLAATGQYRFDGLIWFDAWDSHIATSLADSTVRVWQWDHGATPVEVEVWPVFRPARMVSLVADTIWYVEHDAIMRATVGSGSGIRDDGSGIRPTYAILGNSYPNPFNGGTTIPLTLRPGDWEVSVYNILGQHVKSWSGRAIAPGPQELRWEPGNGGGTNQASGVYFIQASNAGIVETRKVLYLK